MYLWRRLATPQWWIDHEEILRARASSKLALIERPNRKRLQIEVASESRADLRDLVKKFGGRLEKLPPDWLKRGQKTQPIRIGNRNLIIPAGAAFGTGEHATTAMSLRLLARISRKLNPGWSMVDLGTGSGILALAAKCLGSKRVLGIDLDPMAISTAKDNARRNKVGHVEFKLADVRRWKIPRKIDIVTANLFSELLIEVLPRLRRADWLILSGVLREQEREFVRALKRNKAEIATVQRRGKWLAILARGSGAR